MQDKDYTLYQLVTHEDFIQWVKSPDPEGDANWQQWANRKYGRKSLLEEARSMVLSLDFSAENMAPGQKVALKHRIKQSIEQNQHIKATPTSPLTPHISRRMMYYAAVLAAIIIAGAYWFQNLNNSSVKFRTAYGEIATYTLPDSSVVTMNANSELTYRFDEIREVWLEGEAYFEVKKLTNGQNSTPFIVHTEKLDVRVLGTEFNVNTRRDNTSITLAEGKVALNAPRAQVSVVNMEPGERAVLNNRNQLNLRQVNPALYTSWKDHELNFNHNTISEIAAIIEDTYGYKVVILNEELKRREFTGTLPGGDLDMFLSMLEEIFNAQIKKQDHQIIMK